MSLIGISVQWNVVDVVSNYSLISTQISDKGCQLLWEDSAERSYLLSFASYRLVIYFGGDSHCQGLPIDFAPNGDRFTCPSHNLCPVSLV